MAARRRRVLQVGALAAVIAACVGYLVYTATAGSAEYYQTIPEVKAHPQAGVVRVLGAVGPDVRREGDLVDFTATDGTQQLPVEYRGTVPDIFQPGIQVVVEGQQGKDGVFHARTLLAKCPSRFTAKGATPGT